MMHVVGGDRHPSPQANGINSLNASVPTPQCKTIQHSTVFASIYAWVQGRQYSYTPDDWQRCLVAPNKGGVGAGEFLKSDQSAGRVEICMYMYTDGPLNTNLPMTPSRGQDALHGRGGHLRDEGRRLPHPLLQRRQRRCVHLSIYDGDPPTHTQPSPPSGPLPLTTPTIHPYHNQGCWTTTCSPTGSSSPSPPSSA